MAVRERRIVGPFGGASRLDRPVHGAVELAERVREALGVPGGQELRRGGGIGLERRVAEQQLVRALAVAEPQLLRALGGPLHRTVRAVDLPRARVTPPGAELGDRADRPRAALEPQHDPGDVLRLDLARYPLAVHPALAPERLDWPGGYAAHGDDRREV